jgi:hypothetical protein
MAPPAAAAIMAFAPDWPNRQRAYRPASKPKTTDFSHAAHHGTPFMSDFLSAVADATAAMRDLFPETPLQENVFLSQKYGARVFLKREDLSPVRSYKIRGAFNFIRKRLAEGRTGRSSARRPATTRRASPSSAGTSTSRASSSCR